MARASRGRAPQGPGRGRRKNKALVVAFDEEARREFVTGFRKRKEARRKEGERRQQEQARQRRIEERAQRRLQIKIARGLVRPDGTPVDGPGGGEQSGGEEEGAVQREGEGGVPAEVEGCEEVSWGTGKARRPAGAPRSGDGKGGEVNGASSEQDSGPDGLGTTVQTVGVQVYQDEGAGLVSTVTISPISDLDGRAQQEEHAIRVVPKASSRQGRHRKHMKLGSQTQGLGSGSGSTRGNAKKRGQGRPRHGRARRK